MKKLIIPLLLVIFCSGCVTTNPFTKFYTDRTGGVDITTSPNVIIPTEKPKIFKGDNVDSDTQRLFENGYSLLGFSSFNAGEVSEGRLIAQAKKVNAEMVIFYSKYTNTVSGSVPLTLPDTTTITSHGSGTGYGSGNIYGYGGSASYSGSGSYYGSSQTTVYGSKTTYIPYSQNRYDYLATFWIKMKPSIFGVWMDDLTPDLREKIGSNKGALVKTVVKGSPAFMADVLVGDIIKKINDIEITDARQFHEMLPSIAGQTVSVELLRDNKSVTKQITLNKPE